MTDLPWRWIRSRRKTAAIEVTPDGEILLRTPYRMRKSDAEALLLEKKDWVLRALERVRARRDAHPEPTDAEKEALRRRAKEAIPEKVARYASVMGLRPTGIRITSARKRFGSCSPSDSLSFSLYLMQYPDEAVDYVVVHELAHIVHKNHSKDFYALVASVLPDYRDRIRMLKK